MNIKIKHRVDEIVQLTNDGFNNNEIAEKLGANPPAIKYWQKKLGIKANPVPINKLSDEQKLKVLELYEIHKNALLVAKLVGSTQFLVLEYLKKQGIDTSNRMFKGDQEDEIIEQYESGMTLEEIAKQHGCDSQAVSSLFSRRGIVGRKPLERKQLTWYVNQNAFTDWKDERTLFYYGLLLSDGCLLDNGIVIIALQKSDKHILESFAEYMQCGNPIYDAKKDGSNYGFRFKDMVVAENLRKAGMAPRKSSEESYPEFVDRNDLEAARHFWRGYICGDGSVRAYKGLPRLHICGSKEICEEFKMFCEAVLGYELKANVCLTKDKRENRTKQLYYFRICGRKARDVSLFMFENSTVFINRKYEDVMGFKNWQPKPKAKAYGVYEKSGKFEVVFYAKTKSTSPVAVFDTKEEAIKYRLELELQHYGYLKSLA